MRRLPVTRKMTMPNLNGNFPRPDHNATRVPSWSQFAAITFRYAPLAVKRLMLMGVSQRPPHGFATEAEHTAAQEECADWAEQIRQSDESA